MSKDFVMQLRYIGVFPQLGHREYRFNIEKQDVDRREVVLTIDDSLFAARLLMFQEAPDLCYQKLLQALHDESDDNPISSRATVTASDVALYRDAHPNVRLRRQAGRL